MSNYLTPATPREATKLAQGTSLQGIVQSTVHRLRQMYGDPFEFDGSGLQWVLKAPDGRVVTVYATAKMPPPSQRGGYVFHVGGPDRHAVADLSEDMPGVEPYRSR